MIFGGYVAGVQRCELPLASGDVCRRVAVAWCRDCDQAMCARHEHACLASDVAPPPQRDPLADIKDAIRSLRANGRPGALVARGRTSYRPFLRPWARRVEVVYSISYWPVGRFAWSQSSPGGFGQHDLISLGVREVDTVVSERGQITRAVEAEIFAGGAPLTYLQSAPTALAQIAVNLRTFLSRD